MSIFPPEPEPAEPVVGSDEEVPEEEAPLETVQEDGTVDGVDVEEPPKPVARRTTAKKTTSKRK